MHRFRFNLTLKTKLSLYYTLIYPYITYSNLTLSSTYVSNSNGIFSLQKRAVRAITNADFHDHSNPLFLPLGILDIFKVNSFYVARFMFRYNSNVAINTFKIIFDE